MVARAALGEQLTNLFACATLKHSSDATLAYFFDEHTHACVMCPLGVFMGRVLPGILFFCSSESNCVYLGDNYDDQFPNKRDDPQYP